MVQWWECFPPTNVALVQSWPQCHIWVQFIWGSHLAPRVFSSYSGFLTSTKTNISKIKDLQDKGLACKPPKVAMASSLNIVNLI